MGPSDDNEEHDWIDDTDPAVWDGLALKAVMEELANRRAEIVALKKGIRSLMESRKKWKRRYHEQLAARHAAESRANFFDVVSKLLRDPPAVGWWGRQ